MKTFLTLSLLTILFSGCAKHSAFSDFNLTLSQERSEDSIQSAKIYNKTKTVGLFSSIYLNRVYPQKYKDGEYFYIYLYTKEDAKNLDFFLNNKPALSIKSLESTNEFSKLTSPTESWKEYYLVQFKKEGKKLTLQVKNSQISSDPMIFKKDDN